MSLREITENWYEGEFIPYKKDPYDLLVVIGGTYKRHWTASVARMLVKFWSNHWQWTVGMVVAICGLLRSLTRH
jgi:hypothetical protein